jgi:hypothetical protein
MLETPNSERSVRWALLPVCFIELESRDGQECPSYGEEVKESKKSRVIAVPGGGQICSLTLRVGSFDAGILPTQRVRLQNSKGAKKSKNTPEFGASFGP